VCYGEEPCEIIVTRRKMDVWLEWEDEKISKGSGNEEALRPKLNTRKKSLYQHCSFISTP
jgi:hypothetical protein